MSNQLRLLVFIVVISGALCTVEDYVIMSQCAHNKAIHLTAEGTVSVTDISQTQNITIVGLPDYVNNDFKIALLAKETKRYLCFNDHWKLVGMQELQDTCYFNETIVHGYFVFRSVVDLQRRVGFTHRGKPVGPKKHVNDACYLFTKIPADQFFHQHTDDIAPKSKNSAISQPSASPSSKTPPSTRTKLSRNKNKRVNAMRNNSNNNNSNNNQNQQYSNGHNSNISLSSTKQKLELRQQHNNKNITREQLQHHHVRHHHNDPNALARRHQHDLKQKRKQRNRTITTLSQRQLSPSPPATAATALASQTHLSPTLPSMQTALRTTSATLRFKTQHHSIPTIVSHTTSLTMPATSSSTTTTTTITSLKPTKKRRKGGGRKQRKRLQQQQLAALESHAHIAKSTMQYHDSSSTTVAESTSESAASSSTSIFDERSSSFASDDWLTIQPSPASSTLENYVATATEDDFNGTFESNNSFSFYDSSDFANETNMWLTTDVAATKNQQATSTSDLYTLSSAATWYEDEDASDASLLNPTPMLNDSLADNALLTTFETKVSSNDDFASSSTVDDNTTTSWATQEFDSHYTATPTQSFESTNVASLESTFEHTDNVASPTQLFQAAVIHSDIAASPKAPTSVVDVVESLHKLSNKSKVLYSSTTTATHFKPTIATFLYNSLGTNKQKLHVASKNGAAAGRPTALTYADSTTNGNEMSSSSSRSSSSNILDNSLTEFIYSTRSSDIHNKLKNNGHRNVTHVSHQHQSHLPTNHTSKTLKKYLSENVGNISQKINFHSFSNKVSKTPTASRTTTTIHTPRTTTAKIKQHLHSTTKHQAKPTTATTTATSMLATLFSDFVEQFGLAKNISHGNTNNTIAETSNVAHSISPPTPATTTRKALRKSMQKLLATPFHRLTYVRNNDGDIDIDNIDNISVYPDLLEADLTDVSESGYDSSTISSTGGNSRLTIVGGYLPTSGTAVLPESIRIAQIKIDNERRKNRRLRYIGSRYA